MLTALLVMTGIALLLGAGLGFASIKFKVEGDPLVDKIDAILPQTQCGQCGFPGCRPYANAIAGGNSGPALIAGNPNGSLLMQRITGQVPPQMPRGGGAPLSAADIALVAAWIQAGMPE